MNEEAKVIQEGNTVKGDLAGHDIINFHSSKLRDRQSQMSVLLAKFKTEQQGNTALIELIEDLEHYSNPVSNEIVVGLEAKLKAGNRESFLHYAKGSKELFVKKLYKYQFSESAQRINAHLLALVEFCFITHIYPLICLDTNFSLVNSLLEEKIINPVLDELEENLLGYTVKDINGMMYFLTGNCHIKWTK